MVLTAYFRALPGDRVFDTVAGGLIIHQLDATAEASGPHDLAVRFRAVRQERIHVHRIPLRVRDDREPPPLEGTGRARYTSDLLFL
jgi:hypothetical protein